ncbi:MAG: nucleotidyltransferase domain-containing protein [Planctomycetes bacterium]|nr:nucleotidyltransferase domain-containing protein [Planctomycetota bacterium]
MHDRQAILDQIVERLVPAFRPRRIYLFGSQARGDAGPDSDYDVLMVLDVLTDQRWRLCQQAYLALGGVPAAVDVDVCSLEDFERRLPAAASLPATVAREGKLLFAA